MRNNKKFSGNAGEDTKNAMIPHDNDFRLRMREIGRSVTLLWPANIKRILDGADNSRLATRLAGMAQEIIGKTADDACNEIGNKGTTEQ